MTKKVLFVNRQPPHGSQQSKDQLQMAMVFGAFEQHVSMLFAEDGVFSLVQDQKSSEIGFEDYAKIYRSLDKFYDISNIYVDRDSLLARNLSASRLLVEAECLDSAEIESLMRQQDFIFSI